MAEIQPFIDTWQKCGKLACAALDQAYEWYLSQELEFHYSSKENDVADFTWKSVVFKREDGRWYRRHRLKNSAYGELLVYFSANINVSSAENKTVYCRMKVATPMKAAKRALKAIARDVGENQPVSWEDLFTAAVPKALFDSGKIAYEIFIDGTWKRLR